MLAIFFADKQLGLAARFVIHNFASSKAAEEEGGKLK